MKKAVHVLLITAAIAWNGAQAQSGPEGSEGHFYLGGGISALALDSERVPFVATSSPGHSSKLVDLIAGYQFNDRWAADFTFGTEFDNLDVDVFAVNGYRFFGSRSWRPYLSAGLSIFSLDELATDDDTEQVQLGAGVSGNLSRNLELRVGYQSFFTISDESYQDNKYSASLVWHFRKPQAVAVAEPKPEPKPEPMPAPAPPPVEREVIKTYELQVLFDFDRSAIKSAYEPQFQEIAQVLKDNPDVTLMVEGHTCWIGTEQYNQGLSQRRADAVKEKFVAEHGLEPGRIETIGYGESRPVADNETREGRRKNRRAIAITLGPKNVSQ